MSTAKVDLYTSHDEFAIIDVPLVLREYGTINQSELLGIESPNHFLDSNRAALAHVKGTDPDQALSFTDFSRYNVIANKGAQPNMLFLQPKPGYKLLYATMPASVTSPVLYVAQVTLSNGQMLEYGRDWFVLRPDFSTAYGSNKFYVLFTPLSTNQNINPGTIVTAKCLVARNFFIKFTQSVKPLLPITINPNPKVLPLAISIPLFSHNASYTLRDTLKNLLNSTRTTDVEFLRKNVPYFNAHTYIFVTFSFDYVVIQSDPLRTLDEQIRPFFPEPSKVRAYVLEL